MSKSISYDENEMWHSRPDFYLNIFELILNALDDLDFGYFFEVDLKYPDDIRKTKDPPFCPEIKVLPKDKYNEWMKKIKLKSYKKARKLVCDWTDKKNYLIHYIVIKFYARYGMIVGKV